MYVRIVLSPSAAAWILGKFANELVTHLRQLGVEADCAPEPTERADVHHWIHYLYFRAEWTRPINTLMITHIDGPGQLMHAVRSLRQVEAGVCMSQATVEQLARFGGERDKLVAVVPAPSEGFTPRRIVIGVATRRYEDGRKREDKLLEVARRLDLQRFHFDIIGAGWEPVIPELQRAGATVRYYPGSADMQRDYDVNRAWVPQFDYYLYMGEDEGSMGFLDALAAGVRTIVTPQGFHLDVPGGIDYPFWTGADLVEVFRSIQRERDRVVQSVATLTWREYARRHLLIWDGLVKGAAPQVVARSAFRTATAATDQAGSTIHRGTLAAQFDFWVRPTISRLRRRVGQLAGRAHYGR